MTKMSILAFSEAKNSINFAKNFIKNLNLITSSLFCLLEVLTLVCFHRHRQVITQRNALCILFDRIMTDNLCIEGLC